MEFNHMLVVGLDGACWPLIEEWIKNGELPNIKKLRGSGVWGDLESTIPPVTCPAWKCYSTGKNPGKLGVFWWNEIDLKEKKIRPASALKFKSKEIWDYLNAYGFKTGIIGMPLTYPPKKVDGFMIAGGPDAGTKGYAYPKGVEEYLRKRGYKVHPYAVFAGEVKEDGPEVKEILEVIKMRFEIAKELTEMYPVHFLQVTSFYINGPLQHFFYNGTPVKKAWKLVDKEIGRLAKDFTYTMIMSDHGTSFMRKNVYINAWLKKEGYLYRHRTLSEILVDLGITIQNIAYLLDKIKLKNFLAKFELLRKLGEKLPENTGLRRGLGGEATLEGVDWKKTKAIALPQGPIYIPTKENYEELRNELIEKLKKLKDPETGKNVFQGIYKREEIYWGPYVNKAPDIMVLDDDEYHNRGGLLNKEIFGTSEWKGNNARYGLFLLNGPGIKKGEKIPHIHIYDLAPIVLTLFGIKPPEDMDGVVRKELFMDDFGIHLKSNTEEIIHKDEIRNVVRNLKRRGKL